MVITRPFMLAMRKLLPGLVAILQLKVASCRDLLITA